VFDVKHELGSRHLLSLTHEQIVYDTETRSRVRTLTYRDSYSDQSSSAFGVTAVLHAPGTMDPPTPSLASLATAVARALVLYCADAAACTCRPGCLLNSRLSSTTSVSFLSESDSVSFCVSITQVSDASTRAHKYNCMRVTISAAACQLTDPCLDLGARAERCAPAWGCGSPCSVRHA
jgi:hypothetical protein